MEYFSTTTSSIDITLRIHSTEAEGYSEIVYYHGSSSGSPSSSLSSPDMKDNLGVDLSFCIPFGSNIHPFLNSPTSSSGSPFGPMFPSGTITQQHSPLPPVSHFSHQMTPHQQSQHNQQHGHQHQMLGSQSIHQSHSQLSAFNGMDTQETITFFDSEWISLILHIVVELLLSM
ncbi:hypothetical protein Y032_0109g110 [Ancylostoma ceylanicum]|uniref:Uncharacterized protein n=1 Tax=Ancylostoma ceylanicum TaxID=53326 RepID=A0A016TEP8_9BILA|nr:hypothetical protein Y032_0109g110 [Ancylostoma ceylanicum]